jgi:TolA-binding protein
MGRAVRGLLSLSLIQLFFILFLLTSPLPSFGSPPQDFFQVGTGAFNEGFYQVAEAQFRAFLRAYPQHAHTQGVMYLLGKALYEQAKFAEAKEVFVALLMSQKDFQASDSVYFWLGRSYEKLADLANAQNSFLAVVTKFPQSPWYHTSLFLLGKISFLEGQYKKSEMYLKKSLHEHNISSSLSINTKFWLGLTLYEQGRYREAEDLLQEVANSKSKEDLLEGDLYWLGEVYVKLKQYKRGVSIFRSLLKNFPQSSLSPHAIYWESHCLYLIERKEEALKGLLTLKNSFSHTPLLPHVLPFIGTLYIDLHRYQDAIEVFKEFISRFPENQMRGQTLLKLGWCYLKRGDLVQVKEIAYQIVKLSPVGSEKALAQYILAELNTYEGNCQEAMPYWFNLLNTDPYRQEALSKISLCSFQEGKYKESLVNIDLLQLEYPNFYKMGEAIWIQGESFRELGNISESIKAYLRVIKEYKKTSWYPWCLYRLITIFLDEDNIRESEKYFQTLQKKYPSHELCYEAALRVGIKKVEKAEYESALSYLTIAAHASNRNVVKNSLCWQGEIYFNRNEYQKALDSYQRVVVENPSSGDEFVATAYLEMGNIKYLLDDQKQAKEAYKKALEISHDKKFKEMIKMFLKELKESKQAGS